MDGCDMGEEEEEEKAGKEEERAGKGAVIADAKDDDDVREVEGTRGVRAAFFLRLRAPRFLVA